MRDPFIILMADMFYYLQDKGVDGYSLIKLDVPLKMLMHLYDRFEMSEIRPIEIIEEDKKQRYWNIGKSFYENKEEVIRASKAAYMLSLITSND